MCDPQQAQTVTVKTCLACSAALLERDRFCRLCGTRQPDLQANVGAGETGQSDAVARAWSTPLAAALLTTPLDPQHAVIYRSVSGPLVRAVVAGVTVNATSQLHSRALRRAIRALISLPIWLIILLLSPLDAYAAARSLSSEV